MAFFRKQRSPVSGLDLIAGLGNPGNEYRRSRHNAGFMVAAEFISRHGLERPRGRYQGRWTEGRALRSQVAVLMPQTFMNRSGDSVAEVASKKHIPAGRITVIHDDLDFPFGVVRCRQGGGAGGHNGLTSIIRALGTDSFNRVRIGIGRPPEGSLKARDWVLSPFEQSDEALREVIDLAVDCVDKIIEEGIESAMRSFNRREKEISGAD